MEDEFKMKNYAEEEEDFVAFEESVISSLLL